MDLLRDRDHFLLLLRLREDLMRDLASTVASRRTALCMSALVTFIVLFLVLMLPRSVQNKLNAALITWHPLTKTSRTVSHQNLFDILGR